LVHEALSSSSSSRCSCVFAVLWRQASICFCCFLFFVFSVRQLLSLYFLSLLGTSDVEFAQAGPRWAQDILGPFHAGLSWNRFLAIFELVRQKVAMRSGCRRNMCRLVVLGGGNRAVLRQGWQGDSRCRGFSRTGWRVSGRFGSQWLSRNLNVRWCFRLLNELSQCATCLFDTFRCAVFAW
jgi:hypothetical protein